MGARGRTRRGQRRNADALDAVLERPLFDYLGAAGVVAILLGLSERFAGVDVLGHLDGAQRADLYGRLIGPLSIVASIATAGLAVYAGATGPTMTLLRRWYGQRVLKQFRGAAAAAGLAVLALLVVYVAQVGYEADWSRWIALGAAAFVILRTLRVLYFYSNVLAIIDEDKTPADPLPSLDDLPPQRRAPAA